MNKPTNSLCLHSNHCLQQVAILSPACTYCYVHMLKKEDCTSSSLFWNVTHHRLVVCYWCCETLSVPSSRVKTAWPLKLRLIGWPRMSVHNFQSLLCKIPEEQRSHMHHVRSLKPCKTASAYINCWCQSLSSCSLVLLCGHPLFQLCQAYIFINICSSVYKW